MATFTYTAMDAKGKEMKGTIEATNQSVALTMIRERNLYPTVVHEVGAKKTSGGAQTDRGSAAGTKGARGEIKMPGFMAPRVKAKHLMVFTRQLATLIDAGLPLLRGLRVIERQEENTTLKRTIREMAESIQSGGTLAESLAQHPRVFNRLFVNMARAGEIGGVLDVVLGRLADFMEKMQKIKNKIISAMTYPVVVLFLALVIVTFLFIAIIPKFQEIFDEMLRGAQLPALTRFVMGISENMIRRGPVIIGVIVLIIVLITFVARFDWGRLQLDRMKFRMPLFGPLVRKTAIARFSRTLGTLMNAGVPVLQSLAIVRDTAGNEVVGRAIMVVHDAVKEGESIASPLEATGIFPSMVVGMVEVGEETGALPEMLMKVADSYDDEVDNAVAALSSVLEPIMIVGLALIVGTIVISLFLPMIEIIGRMSE